jgi:hypothetical protein
VPAEVQSAPQDGWVRRGDGVSVRASEPEIPAVEVAVLGVAIYRSPAAPAPARPSRQLFRRGLDWAVMPLQVTILLGMGLVEAGSRVWRSQA